jgi:hypothetical protein
MGPNEANIAVPGTGTRRFPVGPSNPLFAQEKLASLSMRVYHFKASRVLDSAKFLPPAVRVPAAADFAATGQWREGGFDQP